MHKPSTNREKLSLFSDLLVGPKEQTQLENIPASDRVSPHTIEDVEDVMLACSSREGDLRGRKPEPPQEDIDYAFEPKVPLQQQVRDSYDPAKANEFFLKFAERGMWMVPGLVSVEAPIAPFTADDWEEINDPTSIKRPRREVRAILEDKAEFHRALLLVHDMRSMGVQFLAGTGTLGKNVVPGRSIHREVELLVKSGFTTLD